MAETGHHFERPDLSIRLVLRPRQISLDSDVDGGWVDISTPSSTTSSVVDCAMHKNEEDQEPINPSRPTSPEGNPGNGGQLITTSEPVTEPLSNETKGEQPVLSQPQSEADRDEPAEILDHTDLCIKSGCSPSSITLSPITQAHPPNPIYSYQSIQHRSGGEEGLLHLEGGPTTPLGNCHLSHSEEETESDSSEDEDEEKDDDVDKCGPCVGYLSGTDTRGPLFLPGYDNTIPDRVSQHSEDFKEDSATRKQHDNTQNVPNLAAAKDVASVLRREELKLQMLNRLAALSKDHIVIREMNQNSDPDRARLSPKRETDLPESTKSDSRTNRRHELPQETQNKLYQNSAAPKLGSHQDHLEALRRMKFHRSLTMRQFNGESLLAEQEHIKWSSNLAGPSIVTKQQCESTNWQDTPTASPCYGVDAQNAGGTRPLPTYSSSDVRHNSVVGRNVDSHGKTGIYPSKNSEFYMVHWVNSTPNETNSTAHSPFPRIQTFGGGRQEATTDTAASVNFAEDGNNSQKQSSRGRFLPFATATTPSVANPNMIDHQPTRPYDGYLEFPPTKATVAVKSALEKACTDALNCQVRHAAHLQLLKNHDAQRTVLCQRADSTLSEMRQALSMARKLKLQHRKMLGMEQSSHNNHHELDKMSMLEKYSAMQQLKMRPVSPAWAGSVYPGQDCGNEFTSNTPLKTGREGLFQDPLANLGTQSAAANHTLSEIGIAGGGVGDFTTQNQRPHVNPSRINHAYQDYHMQLEQLEQANKKRLESRTLTDMSRKVEVRSLERDGSDAGSKQVLADYNMQMMLLDQHRRKQIESQHKTSKVEDTKNNPTGSSMKLTAGNRAYQDYQMQLMLLEQQNRKRLVLQNKMVEGESLKKHNADIGALSGAGRHAQQDYQFQLMLLEMQNKKRLAMSRQFAAKTASEKDHSKTGIDMSSTEHAPKDHEQYRLMANHMKNQEATFSCHHGQLNMENEWSTRELTISPFKTRQDERDHPVEPVQSEFEHSEHVKLHGEKRLSQDIDRSSLPGQFHTTEIEETEEVKRQKRAEPSGSKEVGHISSYFIPHNQPQPQWKTPADQQNHEDELPHPSLKNMFRPWSRCSDSKPGSNHTNPPQPTCTDDTSPRPTSTQKIPSTDFRPSQSNTATNTWRALPSTTRPGHTTQAPSNAIQRNGDTPLSSSPTTVIKQNPTAGLLETLSVNQRVESWMSRSRESERHYQEMYSASRSTREEEQARLRQRHGGSDSGRECADGDADMDM